MPSDLIRGWIPVRVKKTRQSKDRRQPSVVEARGVALRLDVAAALLAFQPPLLRAEGRLGGAPRYRPYHGFAQYFEQAVNGVGAVALLGAEALGVDHDHAVLGHALAGDPVQPQGRVFRQRDLARIEAE